MTVGTLALPSRDRDGQMSDGPGHVVGEETKNERRGQEEGGNQRGKSITAQTQGERPRLR